MIGRLRGKVEAQGEDWVIVDVGGVGYEIFCSSRVLAWARRENWSRPGSEL